jgi:leucyl-tRNA synthetase
MTYGDGAVMGVPAHDERDFAFALKYGIPIRQVVGVAGESAFDDRAWQAWYGDKSRGVVMNSGVFDGLTHPQAVDAIAKALGAKGLGEKKTTWRLRDWGVSRQRYWGTPIPIIHCDGSAGAPGCGSVPVPEKDLPVVLPEDLLPDGSGNPLNKSAAFLNVACPQCGRPARRETDTMDTFVDSAWYYMRYCCPDSSGAMVDARTEYWMGGKVAAKAGMDQYIGGIEHAVLHLLYARFWTKVMRDLGLVSFDEPFARLFTQGMLLNESFYRDLPDGKKQWYYPSEVEITCDERGAPISAKAKSDGLPVMLGGIEKMSKSKNNVVEPRDIIERFGADTARMFTMFAGPPDQSAAWSDSGAEGAFRFLRRLWGTAYRLQGRIASAAKAATPTTDGLSAAAAALRLDMHSLLRQIHHDYERLQYNTVISGAMKMLNAVDGATLEATAADNAALAECFGILIRVLYPAAPHITHALWQDLGYAQHHGDLMDAPWPAVDEAALVQSSLKLVLQVNGKTRGQIEVAADADQKTIEAAALASGDYQRFAEGKAVRKVIVVPGRLVNVVVG